MNRREMVGALGAGASSLTAMGAGAAFARGQTRDRDREHDREDEHHILDECARICNEMAAHCLHRAHEAGIAENRREGKDLHARVHRATMDCQAFCQLTSALMARESEMACYAHEACANACRDCAEACSKGRDLDERLKRCEEICRRCERHCRQQVERGKGERNR